MAKGLSHSSQLDKDFYFHPSATVSLSESGPIYMGLTPVLTFIPDRSTELRRGERSPRLQNQDIYLSHRPKEIYTYHFQFAIEPRRLTNPKRCKNQL